MFNTIVVGVDGREGGRDALHLARRLAAVGDGRLVAVRVYPYVIPLRGMPPVPDVVLDREARRHLEEELAVEGITAAPRVLGDSSPARALHRVAEAEHADLIVVGSTHHGRLGRVLAGDDAVAALHGSPCPVAVAPRGDTPSDAGPPRRIGIGYDGRPESREALALARELAGRTGAKLELRWMVAAPVPVDPERTADPDWLPRYGEASEAALRAVLEELGENASGATAIGEPAEELVRLSHRVDVLVVGSRAWGPVRRILVGSTAARVLHGAACPVVVVPRGAATGEPGEREPTGSQGAVTA